MSNKIVTIDFKTPTSFNLDDQVSLRTVHTTLVENGWSGDKFTDWVKIKLRFYKNGKDYAQLREKAKTGKGASGWQTTEEYYTSVQIAMEILANGHGEIGHQMRQFMSSCVRKITEERVVTPMTPLELAEYSLKAWKGEVVLREIAEATIETHKADPITFVKDVSLSAHKVLNKYPNIASEAKKLRQNPNFKKYGDNGLVTIVLKTFGVDSLKAKGKDHFYTIFSKRDVEMVEAKIKDNNKVIRRKVAKV